MVRKEILNEAARIVTGERQAQYGDVEDSFGLIAGLWGDYLNHPVSSKDVALMMILLKVAREKGGKGKADNWVDIAGYAACGGEIATAAKGEKPKDYLKTATDAMRAKYIEFLREAIEEQTEDKHIPAGINNGPFVPSYPPKAGVKCCCTDEVDGDAYNPLETITRDEARERADSLGKGAILIHKMEDGIVINVLWTGMTLVGLSNDKRPDLIPKHMAFADIDEAIEYYDKHRKNPHGLDNLLKLTSICAKLRKVVEEMEDMGVREKVEDPDDIGKILYSATIDGIQMIYWSSGSVSAVDTTDSDTEDITGYIADSIAGARADMIDDINEGDQGQRDRTIHIYDTFTKFCKTLMEEGLIKESQMGYDDINAEEDEDDED